MEAPPRYRRQAQQGPFFTLIGMLPCIGGPFKYGHCRSSQDLLCMKVDMRNLLHAAFLVNSMILAICFLVFDLEWRREVFNSKSNCAWQTELLELFISELYSSNYSPLESLYYAQNYFTIDCWGGKSWKPSWWSSSFHLIYREFVITFYIKLYYTARISRCGSGLFSDFDAYFLGDTRSMHRS